MRPLFLTALVVILSLPPLRVAAQKPEGKAGDKPKTPAVQIAGKTVEQWIQDISGKDPSKAEQAIRALPLLGPEAAGQAAPALLAVLERHSNRYHLDTGVRANATIALGLILGQGQKPDPTFLRKAVNVLRRLLGDPQSVVKYRAAEALGRIGPSAEKAIDRLVELAQDKDTWETRHAAVVALGAVANRGKQGPKGEVVRALCRGLGDAAWQVRLNAAQSLSWLGPPEAVAIKLEAIQALQKAARQEEEPAVRLTIHVAVLKVKGKPDEAHLTAVAKFLDSKNALLRAKAAEFLGGFGAEAKSQVLPLTGALTDPDFQVVAASVWALSKVQSKPGGTYLLAIGRFLGSEEPSLRARAADFLGSYGAEAKTQVPHLIKALKDPAPQVVASTIHALAQVGDGAAEAVPHLEKMVKDTHQPQELQQLAAEALKVIRGGGKTKGKAK
jgi:HEAT repeat protein